MKDTKNTASRLNVKEDSEINLIQREIFADNIPIVIVENYIDYMKVPDFKYKVNNMESLY